MARRAMQSPVTLNGHCLFSLDLPSLKRARWSFFCTSKTTFKRISQNLVQIDYDNENDECDDDNGDNVDDYDDENDPKPDNYHGVIVKIYPSSLIKRFSCWDRNRGEVRNVQRMMITLMGNIYNWQHFDGKYIFVYQHLLLY